VTTVSDRSLWHVRSQRAILPSWLALPPLGADAPSSVLVFVVADLLNAFGNVEQDAQARRSLLCLTEFPPNCIGGG
jgi:hypothetical protein